MGYEERATTKELAVTGHNNCPLLEPRELQVASSAAIEAYGIRLICISLGFGLGFAGDALIV
jgi:hypothetical protein